MRISSTLIKSTIPFLLALAITVSPALAGSARYFKDRNQAAYRVSLHANPSRVLSATFIVYGKETLHCEGAIIQGAWTINNIRINNGRFQAVKTDSSDEPASSRLMFRGTLKDDTIRGSLSLHLAIRHGVKTNNCWSGNGKSDPLVRYVAKAVK